MEDRLALTLGSACVLQSAAPSAAHYGRMRYEFENVTGGSVVVFGGMDVEMPLVIGKRYRLEITPVELEG